MKHKAVAETFPSERKPETIGFELQQPMTIASQLNNNSKRINFIIIPKCELAECLDSIHLLSKTSFERTQPVEPCGKE